MSCKYIELDSCSDCPDFDCSNEDVFDKMICKRCEHKVINTVDFPFPKWCPLMGRDELENKWYEDEDKNSCIGNRDSL